MLKNLPAYIANARKAIVQIIGLAGALLALGLLPDKYAAWVSIVIGVLTTVLHYLTPNADAPGTTPAEDSTTPPVLADVNEPSYLPVVDVPADDPAPVDPAPPAAEIADPANPATPLTPAVPPSA